MIYHLLKLFINDCKDLVLSTVQHSIKTQRRSTDAVTNRHGNARQAALKAWLALDNPLSYGDGQPGNTGGYQLLLIILDEDPRNPIKDLNTSEEQFTYHEMGILFYSNGTMASQGQMSCPLIKFSSCLPALPLGLARIKQVASLDVADRETIAALFARMVRKMGIQIVPWHREDRKDTRAIVARSNWWLKVKHSGSTQAERALDNTPANEQSVLAQHALDHNTDAPWSLPETLNLMGPFWNKSRLPSQWQLEHASLPNTSAGDETHYLKETYEYISDIYDARIWWHHMGLVWGILFSKITPFLCISKTIMIQPTDSVSILTREVQQIPWIKSTSKTHRGITLAMPFITMMSTTIIALLDSRSPLRRRMTRNNNSMGSVWTKKHGMKANDNYSFIRVTNTILYRT